MITHFVEALFVKAGESEKFTSSLIKFERKKRGPMSEDFCALVKYLREAPFRELHCRRLGKIEQTAVGLKITSKAEENREIKKSLSGS